MAIGIIAMFLFSCGTSGQKNNADKVTESVQSVLDSIITHNEALPGILIHIEAPDYNISWSGAAGVLDTASGKPLAPDQSLRIASNTKTFVAATVLKLWEQGRLALDEPMTKYVAEQHLDILRNGGYKVDSITIRHLLTHTSGIFDHAQSDQFFETIAANPQKEWTRTEQIQGAVEWGDAYGTPGERFSYSDTGYILLGEIIEKITGKSLAQATHEAVDYEKLGMDATWWELQEQAPADVKGRAHQYLDGYDTYDFNPTMDINGGGGIVSTTGDLSIFLDQLFAGNVYTNPATLDTMVAVVKNKVPNEPFNDYRMGLYTRTISDLRAYEHSGFWAQKLCIFPTIISP